MIRKKSIMAAALAAVLACQTFPAFGGAAPDGKTLAQDTEAAQGGAYDAWKERWKELSGDWTQVSITPGADETQMNFAWYSRKGEDAGFRYGKQADLSDGTDAEVKSTDAQEGYQSNKVTLTGLEPGSVYYYQAGGKAVSRLETRDPDSFSFIFVGDPQIGSSNEEKAKKPEDILKDTFKTAQYESVMSDSFNWNHTLELAVEKPKPEFNFRYGRTRSDPDQCQKGEGRDRQRDRVRRIFKPGGIKVPSGGHDRGQP